MGQDVWDELEAQADLFGMGETCQVASQMLFFLGCEAARCVLRDADSKRMCLEKGWRRTTSREEAGTVQDLMCWHLFG